MSLLQRLFARDPQDGLSASPADPKGGRGGDGPPAATPQTYFPRASEETMEMDVDVVAGTPEPEILSSEDDAPAPAPAAPDRPPLPRRKAKPGANTTGTTAVRATFLDLAITQMTQVRSFVLDLQSGQAPASWIDVIRPALRSLRSEAEQMEMRDLVAALDGFLTAVDRSGGGPFIGGDRRETLLAAYRPLVNALPRAFAVDGDRDQREQLIVDALFRQVPGLEPLMIDRLRAAGLGRLESLGRARAEELAAARIPHSVADELIARVKVLAASPGGALTLDPADARREIQRLVSELQVHHEDFERAAAAWSVESRESKRLSRVDRERTYAAIKVALARSGDSAVVARLERMSFGARVEELIRYARGGGWSGSPDGNVVRGTIHGKV